MVDAILFLNKWLWFDFQGACLVAALLWVWLAVLALLSAASLLWVWLAVLAFSSCAAYSNFVAAQSSTPIV